MARRFLSERRRDPYYRAAQREGLRSRAAFKLAYLDDRFHLFRPGFRVLDLGAAPGGWSLVARERVGARGAVVAVDPRPLAPIDGVRFVRGRVGDPSLLTKLGADRYDVVLSDMSPRISGAYATDHARSVALVREAFGVATGVLARGGTLVTKVFDGDLLEDVSRELGAAFVSVRRTKPPASREPSSELYLLAFGYRRVAAPVPARRESPVGPAAAI